MEALAKMFEQEKGISDEVENQVKQIHQIEDDYVPFSEMEHKAGRIRKCCTKAQRSIEMVAPFQSGGGGSRKKRKVTTC